MIKSKIKDDDNIIYFEDRLKLLDSLLKKESIKTISEKLDNGEPDYIKLKGSLKESLCKDRFFYLINCLLSNSKIYELDSLNFYSYILELEINKIKSIFIKNDIKLEYLYSDGFSILSQMLENDFFEVEETYDRLLKQYRESYLIEGIFENLDNLKEINERKEDDDSSCFNVKNSNRMITEIKKQTKEKESKEIIIMMKGLLEERDIYNSFVIFYNIMDQYISYYNNDDVNYNFKTLKDFSKDFNISYSGLIYLLSKYLKDNINDYIYLETGEEKDKGLLAINEINKSVFKEKNMFDKDFVFFKNTKYAFKASLLEVIKEVEKEGVKRIIHNN